MRLGLLLLAILLPAAGGCGRRGPTDPSVLRVGHFPNLTHAHALVLRHRSRAGAGPKVEWYSFAAGPEAMEALLGGALDLAYVGPNPAINAHLVSRGREVRVVSGATRGGSALVVRGDGKVRGAQDLRGRLLVTPQMGNTQDVSARVWLLDQGLRVADSGGDVSVHPMMNPDILDAFRRGDVDGAWTVEPWVSRLEVEAGGTILVEEKDALTTVLVATVEVLRDRPALVKAFLAAHRTLTPWLREHSEEARAEVRAELLEETRVALPPEVAGKAWPRLSFDDRISLADFETFVKKAQRVGFLKEAGSLERLVVAP